MESSKLCWQILKPALSAPQILVESPDLESLLLGRYVEAGAGVGIGACPILSLSLTQLIFNSQ
ncbi:hypothetical protein FOCG_09285 [Fusarium oxysporum f. sp. radicis-lycopersici 26381]|uniref:Uncharacterized protein n=3 Tax=Fusarium oxysporum TaxID=5507 RepID=W9I683_FUSOX|nr:hypothetical protein FOYG_09850 [Fusarium oxysporum NRRL 32931]EWZ88229.1 hypothetical protein FOWG_09765 [Fusarium oxysporum f. sp. lycopersici MN25]EXL51223.1 hypothetical protein FOCG_09285 [Fusarium oxysporum f. sp. radicis-lycopersici 26381]EXL88586.1 hypothetical protein FOPG_00841 [Fusarium oxysporum f. sp. conglutinans race 2 54008]EXM35237.1 hypothetical protein FOTG_01745 [Fusarium oxysporum f. sp. vasinfectum 25433]KAI8408357.1 hypothetical protein FOFC_11299 [Fusarium oxysporum]